MSKHDPPTSNVILFANARAGGGAARTIMNMFSKVIGDDHVFDVIEHNPRDVLRREFENRNGQTQLPPRASTAATVAATAEAAEAAEATAGQAESSGKGDPPADSSGAEPALSSSTRAASRIVVAGGDGTVTWILGIIADLKTTYPDIPPPPVAILPLGTGNDLAINLGWGKTFRPSAIKSPAALEKTLSRIANAPTTLVDHWNVQFHHLPLQSGDTLPHAIRLCSPVGEANETAPTASSAPTATSTFWNYLSIGLDAETAYNFHTLREHHPGCTSSRLVNQAWYGIFTCGTGWFCGGQRLAGVHTRDTDDSRRIIKCLRVKKQMNDEFVDVDIPKDIRALVLLNLQTYGGGRDIWGIHNETNLERKGMKRPQKDDGLLEVIGFRNGWHTAVVMGELATQRVHGKRLAQGCAVEIVFDSRDERKHVGRTQRNKTVCMQLDGEPWKQTLSRDVEAPKANLRVAAHGTGSDEPCGGDHDATQGEDSHHPRLTVSWGGRSSMLEGRT